MSRISEAPVQYNIWAAVGVVSAVLKNHVQLSRGPYTVNPNQYIILVGPPGVGKGTAIHPAFDFPKRLGLINSISDRVTAPKIIERLANGFDAPLRIISGDSNNGHSPSNLAAVKAALGSVVGASMFNTTNGPIVASNKESSAIIMSTELQTLLSSSDWMPQFLCDAWDRKDFEYDTKNKGSSFVKDMCVCLMGACVPAYIQSINKSAEAAINGGFTARAVFVYADKKSQDVVWPKSLLEVAGPDLIKKLEDDLYAISQLEGEYSFNNDAKLMFENFYNSPSCKSEESDSDIMQHFKARIHVHAFKVAMALSAAMSDSRVIDRVDMGVAIDLVKQIKANLDRAFRGVGNSPLAEATQKVLNFVERRGAADRKEILKHTYSHVTNEDLNRVLWTLCEMGSIREDSIGGKKLYVFCDPSKTVNAKVKDINTP